MDEGELRYCVVADYIAPEKYFDGEGGVKMDDLDFCEAKKLAEEWESDGIHTNVMMYESDDFYGSNGY